jgi:FAD/FMN-containing dehydrogenase
MSSSFDSLSRRVPLALPGDDRYARLAMPFNTAVTTTPTAVAEARDAEDVAEAVRFAAAAGLPVAVQATGHGIADALDGALLVHTGGLDECAVHYPDGWARVGAGVRWQQVLDAAAPYGLAGLAGSAPGVGVVGYTTGGGLGPVARTFGYASDLVRAVELVTGDGELRRVEPGHELFAAVRGGKGAVGIVTAMEFDLFEQREVYGGALWFDGAAAADVLGAWRTWSQALPEQATTSIALMQLPPLPAVPPPLAGKLTMSVRYVWTGSAADGEELLRPLRKVAEPIVDTVTTLPYASIGVVHSDPVDPMPTYEETDMLRSLPAEAVDALLEMAGPGSGSPQVMVELRQLGGALARPPAEPDMLCHRTEAYNLTVIGVLVPPVADAVPAHGAAVRAAMAPWATGGAEPNFAAGSGADRLARSYDPPTLARLTALADKYDPARLLRVGQVPVR